MDNEKEIIVTQKPELAYSAPAILFFFGTFCILFWANLAGYLGEGGSLVVGIVQLGCFPVFLACTSALIKKGLSFEAGVFLIFNGLFCGAGGLFNFVSSLADFFGIPYAISTMGVVWIVCGIFLFILLIPTRITPLANWLSFLFCAIALLVLGLILTGIVPATLMPIPAWTLFLAGICALWMCTAILCGFMNVTIPLGPPLCKAKE